MSNPRMPPAPASAARRHHRRRLSAGACAPRRGGRVLRLAARVIRKLLERVFSGRSAKAGPKVIAFERHGVARERLSPCARKVVLGLQEAGYAAFVVGGAVRDLLVDLEPKDFDVATSATPEEVKAVFRRSRIIGRRFRLVHVLCGQDTIEVSTFRGSASGEDNDQVRDEHGRILRDNVFGSQAEDAMCAATSLSMPCSTTRPLSRSWTTAAASPTCASASSA